VADWDDPTISSLYADLIAELKARDVDLATLNSGGTVTNPPDGAYRINIGTKRLEVYDEATATWSDALGLLGLSHGGTGRSAFQRGSALVCRADGTLFGEPQGGGSGQVLTTNITTGHPQWAFPNHRGIRANEDGAILSGSRGWTVTKTDTGTYTVDTGFDEVLNMPFTASAHVVPIVAYCWPLVGNEILVKTYSWTTLMDSAFSVEGQIGL